MTGLEDRAGAVALDDGQLLVLRRHKQGEDYCVLPGGGVEAGEVPSDAAIRELREETGLRGAVDRHLWTITHPDRIAHYFLVSVEAGPMTVGGPEALVQSAENCYTPEWISLGQLAAENLQPEAVRDRLTGLLPSPPPQLS